uniref:Uncharacterized protein n=1 Tax=Arundo donax TaxID=35708 RepID=A0A0A9ALZ1_ARUDO
MRAPAGDASSMWATTNSMPALAGDGDLDAGGGDLDAGLRRARLPPRRRRPQPELAEDLGRGWAPGRGGRWAHGRQARGILVFLFELLCIS